MKILFDDKARHMKQTGYGRVARTIAEGLTRNGSNHVVVPYPRKTDQELPPIDNGFFHYDVKGAQNLNKFDICITVGPPVTAQKKDIPTLMYTMVDTSDIPEAWKEKLSTMDGFLTPADKITRIFRQYYENVFEVPLYGDSSTFKPRRRWRNEGAKKFSFVYSGTHCFRKGTDLLIKAFVKEFDFAEAKLTLLCTEKAPDPLFNYILKTIGDEGKAADIEVVTDRLTDSWVARYFSRSDVFVMFSRGEGFGYPQYEAALCGLPVLSTRGLPSDGFLPSDHNYFCGAESLKVENIESDFGESFKQSSKGSNVSVLDVSLRDAQRAMRFVQNIGQEKISKIGLKNADYLSRQNSPQKFSEVLNSSIKQFYETLERV